MFKKISFLILFIILSTISIPTMVNANPPVVVEFFGKNSCKGDDDTQDYFQEILRTKKDIILINCRITYDYTEKQRAENKKFSYSFCTERFTEYRRIFKEKYKYSFPAMLINGHLDANYNDIMPAINFGKTDNIATISLTLNDSSLGIIVPKIKSDIKSGDLLLHIYNKSSNEDTVRPSSNKTQALTPVTKNQLYYRPVISMQVIGKWHGQEHGQEMSLTYSLNNSNSLTNINHEEFGYIVTLRENNSYGKIIAAGEIIPKEEIYSSLPYSKPVINNEAAIDQASQ